MKCDQFLRSILLTIQIFTLSCMKYNFHADARGIENEIVCYFPFLLQMNYLNMLKMK